MRGIIRILLLFGLIVWSSHIATYAQSTDTTSAIEDELTELLNQKHAQMAGGTSTAAKYFQSTQEAPSSVSILTSQEIEMFGYNTFDELLQVIRSLYLTYDRFWHYIGIRGFGRPTDYNNRILLLVNGQTVNNNIFGAGPFGSNLAIDIAMIDRVEIIRGPGSALYGTNAMFGVINIITKTGKTLDGGIFTGAYGSDNRRQVSFSGGKRLGGIQFALSANYADIDGHDLEFPPFQGKSVGADNEEYQGIHLNLQSGQLSLQGHWAERDKGIPNAPYRSNYNDKNCHGKETNGFAEIKYDLDWGLDKSLMTRIYINHFKYDAFYPFSQFPLGTTYLPLYFRSHALFEGNYWGGEFQFKWEIGLNNRLTAGIAYRENSKVKNSFEYLFDTAQYAGYAAMLGAYGITNPFTDPNRGGDFPFSILSFYAQDEFIPFDQLSLTVGIRRDQYSDLGQNVKNQTMPRLAAVWHPFHETSIKLLYGQAYRVPNADELYFDKVGIVNNDSLTSELIKTYEFVAEHRFSENLSATAALYHYTMSDLIDKKPISQSEVRFYNLSEVSATGFELECNYKWGTDVVAYGNYLLQKAENTTDDQELSNSPQHVAKLGVAYVVAKLFSAAFELQYETARYTKSREKSDNILLANLYLKSRPLARYFQLFFKVKNLFNQEYQYPAGFEHFGPYPYTVPLDMIPQDKLTFLTGLQIRI